MGDSSLLSFCGGSPLGHHGLLLQRQQAGGRWDTWHCSGNLDHTYDWTLGPYLEHLRYTGVLTLEEGYPSPSRDRVLGPRGLYH